MKVRLRPLQEADAYVSVHWRNRPEIWRLTGSAPDRTITIEDELAWIRRVMADQSSRRFAIEVDGVYVGNIYLTDIEEGIGEYHIFIGRQDFEGKGVAREASGQLIAYGRDRLGLTAIKLRVRENNRVARHLYERLGFVVIDYRGDFVHMLLALTPEAAN